MQTWQAKKIYYGSDADDNKQFNGSGPAYSVREISPSQKKPYWRLALESAMAHRTQFPEDIERISKLSDAELERMMNDPNSAWWSEPLTLIFGKSLVGGKPTDDVFAHINERPSKVRPSPASALDEQNSSGQLPRVELGGPWKFYAAFYPAHGLERLQSARIPEIGVKTGTMLVIPLVVLHDTAAILPVSLTVKTPDGWKVTHGGGQFVLPAEASTSLAVHIETPTLSADELKKALPQEVLIRAEAEGKPAGEVKLRVLLKASALPE